MRCKRAPLAPSLKKRFFFKKKKKKKNKIKKNYLPKAASLSLHFHLIPVSAYVPVTCSYADGSKQL
jgi:hypothetical protein